MKALLEFLLEGITGKAGFSIEETTEAGQVNLKVYTDPENIGILIGRNGQTIKAIQEILRVKARLEKKVVFVEVAEKK